MPARDIYHDVVKNALVKDGWTITHDPLRLSWGGRVVYIDLGAERLLAAEKAGHLIAVEVKSFAGDSPMEDLERAIGQYVLYRTVLGETEPNRSLYLAVPNDILQSLFKEPLGQLVLKNNFVKVFGFDAGVEVITEWTP